MSIHLYRMIQANNSESENNTELPLNEDEYYEADAALQIQSDLEVGEWQRIRERDDVEKKFELKAGHDNSDRDTPDLRKFIQLFETPAGWLYVVDGPAHEQYELIDDLPTHYVFVDDGEHFIEHSIREHGHDVEDSYEAIANIGVWQDLRRKVESEIEERFGE